MKGYTLIETLIYAFLISLMAGFAILVLYQIIDASNRLSARIEVEEETNFILQKINWALNSSSTVNQPALGATSTTLSINRLNFSQNPIVFNFNSASSSVNLTKAGGGPATLNDSNALVSQLVFQNQVNGPGAPNSIIATITVNSKNFNYSKTTTMVYDLR